ncbi:MAG TPA: hypothetical protein VKA51_09880 [Rubrobacteraceae bacterium]|nr:hypothetical protein [Rubrobacteraceae bacterium]
MEDKSKIVVAGNGNAGAALVDRLLAEDPERVHITLYGDEEIGTYDRVHLSEFMAGTVDLNQLGMRSDGWYEERNVCFGRGVRVEELVTKGQKVRAADGVWVPYDLFLLPADGAAREASRYLPAGA